jgi:hypothetical protein
MKKETRFHPKRLAFALISGCVTLLCACSGFTGAVYQGSSGVASVGEVASTNNLDALFAEKLPGPALPPDEKPDEIICTDYTARGLLRICYPNPRSDKKIKMQVIHGDSTIYYNLAAEGGIEDFSLQYGDGEYTARIMEQTEGNYYYAVEYKTFDVALDEETRVYLNSIQNVDWDYDMEPIREVRYIVAESLDKEDGLMFSCTEDVYNYVVRNIRYDSAKVFDLLYDYLPDIADTYTTGMGICYDYASLFAAMLRSIGIPAKLVKGYASYAPDTYHAWNEVYIEGEWIIVDSTRDASLRSSGSAYKMEKESVNYLKTYEY